MTTGTTLFGLALGPLFAAIAQVESNDGKADLNVYQIGREYVADVNRIREKNCRLDGTIYFELPVVARFDRRSSERMMEIYWRHWGQHYEAKTGQRVSYETLARIHNGGPLGWKKVETERYWAKVKAVMARQAAEAEAAKAAAAKAAKEGGAE